MKLFFEHYKSQIGNNLFNGVLVNGIRLKKKVPYHIGCCCPFKVEYNTRYRLLWLTYFNGDSFGSETGIHEFIGLYKSRESAERSKEIIELHSQDQTILIPMDGVKNPFDKELCYAPPWCSGYFDGFEGCYITEVQLLDEKI